MLNLLSAVGMKWTSTAMVVVVVMMCSHRSQCFFPLIDRYRSSPLIDRYRSSLSPRGTIGSYAKSVADVDLDASIVQSGGGDFEQTFIAQKNFILLEKFIAQQVTGNLTEVATLYVNYCDESFDMFVNERIKACKSESERQVFGKIRYEVNRARQEKLLEADRILRSILSAGELRKMEAKLQYHLRRAEIDMAFMVILQLNIEDAVNAKAENASNVMRHLGTLITEYQDAVVSAPVRLMRLLVRTDDPYERKQMLRQKLLIGANAAVQSGDTAAAEARPTSSPQCEHIVVGAVEKWGGAEVSVSELEDTIADVLSQMSGIGGEEHILSDLEAKCTVLRREVDEVIAELDAPISVATTDAGR